MHRVLPAFARVSFAAGVSFRTVSNRRVILGHNDLRGVVDGFGASSQSELWLCSHAGDDRQSAAEPIQHSAAIDKQSAAVGVYQHQGGRGFVSGKATDKSGNPVTMFIGPNLETEVTTVGLNDQASDPKKGNAEIRSGGMFTSLPAKDELSSKAVGLDVYNNANQNIGTIKDVAYNGRKRERLRHRRWRISRNRRSLRRG